MDLLQGGIIDNRRPIVNPKKNICRNGLLAKVHIARKELGLSDDQYRAVLRGFRAASAAELPIQDLERLVKYLKYLGWKPFVIPRKAPEESRVKALQERIGKLVQEIERGETILAGIVRRLFNVDHYSWVRDEAGLRRILAIMGKIKRQYSKIASID